MQWNKIFHEKYFFWYAILINNLINVVKSLKSLKTPQLVSNHNF